MSERAAIKVESGVPMPKGKLSIEGKGCEIRNALKSMKIGDSFHHNGTDAKAIYHAALQIGVRIVTRKLTTGGYRIWKAAKIKD